MTDSELIRKLKYLRRKWRKSSNYYERAMREECALEDGGLTAARFEGESAAFLRCSEDLEKLL